MLDKILLLTLSSQMMRGQPLMIAVTGLALLQTILSFNLKKPLMQDQ